MTWLALLVLTAASFGATQLALGAAAPAVALGIATIKAVIVMLVFMHLAEASASTRVAILTAIAFILLLVFGIVADVGAR